MAPTDTPRSTGRPRRAPGASPASGITPVFPLLLLETMRDMDRPEEVLEDEDLAVSMPRRFGLSDVVLVQIRRFQEEVRQKRPQGAREVEDLMRLVIRRPDAETIFDEAGRRMARHSWEQRSAAARQAIRVLPRPLASIVGFRAARRMLRRLVGGGQLSLSRAPAELAITDSLTSRADPGGAACAFYAGALAELLQIYTGRRYRVRHEECESRGGTCCRWPVEVAS